ncbi:MAG: hypothetical protein HY667_01645 [Chloroflexi bacterium]|nr:hypothetical protein [Chloroflexota bacterium]
MTEIKYAKHVITLPIVKGKGAPLMSAGADVLNGFNCHIIYAFAFETGITGKSVEPHTHDYDEAVFFLGSDPHNIGDLGAEVEFAIGEEQEKHVFTVPTAVVIPGGLPHCPIITRRIDKPYLCMAVSLTGSR